MELDQNFNFYSFLWLDMTWGLQFSYCSSLWFVGLTATTVANVWPYNFSYARSIPRRFFSMLWTRMRIRLSSAVPRPLTAWCNRSAKYSSLFWINRTANRKTIPFETECEKTMWIQNVKIECEKRMWKSPGKKCLIRVVPSVRNDKAKSPLISLLTTAPIVFPVCCSNSRSVSWSWAKLRVANILVKVCTSVPHFFGPAFISALASFLACSLSSPSASFRLA